MIECHHLSLAYQPGHEVLKSLSFKLAPGSFHFLTGPSGAGKTSLFALLSLLRRPTAGSIRMFGEEVTSLPRESLTRFRRRVGIVLQDFRLLEHLTIAENVGLPLKVMGEEPHIVEQKAHELLEWIGLEGYHDATPEVLSGGQKQRVAIARAVITKPEFLLADEPTGNLDSELSQRLMYLFQALNHTGTTVLVATHDEQLISLFDHPVLRLRDGELHCEYPTLELRETLLS